MTAHVIHTPKTAHDCHVGWEERPLPDNAPLRQRGFTTYRAPVGQYDPPGTIRYCQCGRTWVAYRELHPPGYQGHVVLGTQWRPEGRIARWWRERRIR
jgi:hypothetical protein